MNLKKLFFSDNYWLDRKDCKKRYPSAKYIKTIPKSNIDGGFEIEINPFPNAVFNWNTKMNVRKI